MWICPACHRRNQQGNKKCRNPKCKQVKPIEIIKEEIEQLQLTHVRDLCPVCKKHTDFIKSEFKKNTWTCQQCHKKFKFNGKPVPEPASIQT